MSWCAFFNFKFVAIHCKELTSSLLSQIITSILRIIIVRVRNKSKPEARRGTIIRRRYFHQWSKTPKRINLNYLGVSIISDSRHNFEISSCTAQAKIKHQKNENKQAYPQSDKEKNLRYSEHSIMYQCNAWTIKKKDTQKILEAAQTWFLRKVSTLHKTDSLHSFVSKLRMQKYLFHSMLYS